MTHDSSDTSNESPHESHESQSLTPQAEQQSSQSIQSTTDPLHVDTNQYTQNAGSNLSSGRSRNNPSLQIIPPPISSRSVALNSTRNLSRQATSTHFQITPHSPIVSPSAVLSPSFPLPTPSMIPSLSQLHPSFFNTSYISPTESLLLLSSHHSGLVLHISDGFSMCEAFHHYRSLMNSLQSGFDYLRSIKGDYQGKGAYQGIGNQIRRMEGNIPNRSIFEEGNVNSQPSSIQNEYYICNQCNTEIYNTPQDIDDQTQSRMILRDPLQRLNHESVGGGNYIAIGNNLLIDACRLWWNLQDVDEIVVKDVIIRCGMVCVDQNAIKLKRQYIGPEPWPMWTRIAQTFKKCTPETIASMSLKEKLEMLKSLPISTSSIETRNRHRANWEKEWKEYKSQHSPISVIEYYIASTETKVQLHENERVEPFELFFDAMSDNSLAKLILDTILNTPIASRVEVVQNIILSGFVVDVPGFKSRLFMEIKYLISNVKKYRSLETLYTKFRIYKSNIPGEQMVEAGRKAYTNALNSYYQGLLTSKLPSRTNPL